MLAAAALVPMQLALTYLPPMQRLFGTASLDLEGWLLVLGFAVALFLVVEVEKAVARRLGARSARVPAGDALTEERA
jgi:hypothetical protein